MTYFLLKGAPDGDRKTTRSGLSLWLRLCFQLGIDPRDPLLEAADGVVGERSLFKPLGRYKAIKLAEPPASRQAKHHSIAAELAAWNEGQ